MQNLNVTQRTASGSRAVERPRGNEPLRGANALGIAPPEAAPGILPASISLKLLTHKIGLAQNLFKALSKSGLGQAHSNPFSKLLQAQTATELPAQDDLVSYCQPKQSSANTMHIPQGDLKNKWSDHPCIFLIKEFCKKPFMRATAQAGDAATQPEIQAVAAYLTTMLTTHTHALESLNLLLDRRLGSGEVSTLLKALPNTPELFDTRCRLARNIVLRGIAGDAETLQQCRALPADIRETTEIRGLVAAIHGENIGSGPDPHIERIARIHHEFLAYDSLSDQEKLHPHIALASLFTLDYGYRAVHQHLQNNRDFALLACRLRPQLAGEVPTRFFSDREFLLTAFPEQIDDLDYVGRFIPIDKLEQIPANLRDDYEVALGLNMSGWDLDGDNLTHSPLALTSERLKGNHEFMLQAQRANGNATLSPSDFLAHCADRLKNDAGFMEAFVTSNLFLLDPLHANGRMRFANLVQAIPTAIKNNPDFNLNLLAKNSLFMPFINTSLRGNQEFMLRVVQVNHDAAMNQAV